MIFIIFTLYNYNILVVYINIYFKYIIMCVK